MTGNGDAPPSALARVRNRQEMRLAAALWHADRRMAATWWGLLTARGLLAKQGDTIRLTAQGRLLSNDVFQEFLETAAPDLQPAAG